MILDKLYKLDSKGKLQEWSVEVNDTTIIVRHGKVGGKIQETKDTITEGKNVGKANETTPRQQAEAEARSLWEKQVSRKGYTPDLAKAQAGEDDAAGGIKPMLAHRYDEQGHKIKFPAFTQPKLDGMRCIAHVKNGQVTLWTRERKPIVGVPHIAESIKNTFVAAFGEFYIDGELYNHDLKENFNKLISLVKRNQIGSTQIQYHIYDIFVPKHKLDFRDRYSILMSIASQWDKNLVLVHTEVVGDEEEAVEAFNAFRAQGYEGSMLRNKDGLYENTRSYNLQKVKEFSDSEFEIVGVKTGRGKFKDAPIFTCKLPNGQIFDCCAPGNMEERKLLLKDPRLWDGRKLRSGVMLTVQYQGLTPDGIPRFPVGKAIYG